MQAAGISNDDNFFICFSKEACHSKGKAVCFD